jgi:orotate phosphoribosyltransferase
VPYSALAQVSFPTYQPDACPLCAAGSTAIKPGSRS